ncbi:MAG: lipid-A-disaccharide synthase [bacterium]
MLIAGEASGDLYGGCLAREIKKIREDISLFGMGGRLMEESGVEILFPISLDIVGALDALFKIPKAIFLLNNVLKVIRERKPDKVVLIDFAEFNLYLLKNLVNLKIKTAWLFPPTVWAWRKNRAKIVKKADLILSTLPIERDFYKKEGVNVLFIGHPLLDIVRAEEQKSRRAEEGDNKKRPIISLLPGSREGEIQRHLPVMVEVAKSLSDIELFLILATGVKKEEIEKYIKGLNISIIPHSYNTIAQSDLLITSSGTATLEGAILGIPMVVIYKMDRISFFLAKTFVKTKYVTLPNIIAREKIVPEFLQNDANPSNIAKEALLILNDEKKRKEIKLKLSHIKDAIGPSGAIKRAANAIIEL